MDINGLTYQSLNNIRTVLSADLGLLWLRDQLKVTSQDGEGQKSTYSNVFCTKLYEQSCCTLRAGFGPLFSSNRGLYRGQQNFVFGRGPEVINREDNLYIQLEPLLFATIAQLAEHSTLKKKKESYGEKSHMRISLKRWKSLRKKVNSMNLKPVTLNLMAICKYMNVKIQ